MKSVLENGLRLLEARLILADPKTVSDADHAFLIK